MASHARGHAATTPAEAIGSGLGRAWLVTNPASGSAHHAGPADLLAAIEAEGGIAAGESSFPDEPLPDAATLAADGVETLVVHAGDGTVNAVIRHLRDWPGRLLVLPGGTMNLLARAHHGEAGWDEILARAPTAPAQRLDLLEAGSVIAAVALVAGPWSLWAHAREGVRDGRLARVWRATRLALARSFGEGLRAAVAEGTRLPGRHRMAVIEPAGEGRLAFHGVPARTPLQLASLGAAFLVDDWRHAERVASWTSGTIALEGRGAIAALADGEPVKLSAPVKVTAGTTALAAIRTQGAGEDT